MSSLLKSTSNTRYLPDGSNRYIRSDVPDKLEPAEIEWLRQQGFVTIVDLRDKEERKNRPCVLADCEGFCYLQMPVTGGNRVPESTEQVAQSYFSMVDAAMWKIIERIESADTKVMFFCNAGKDRTGVVSALLLSRLGIDREIIIDDYLQSKENLQKMLQSYAQENPMLNIDIITPKQQYMEEFLDKIKK